MIQLIEKVRKLALEKKAFFRFGVSIGKTATTQKNEQMLWHCQIDEDVDSFGYLGRRAIFHIVIPRAKLYSRMTWGSLRRGRLEGWLDKVTPPSSYRPLSQSF